MTREVRRVVTTHDAAGRAVVMVDGAAPNVKVRPIGGFVSTLLWVLDGVPARHSGDKDFADVTIGTAPPQGGAVFRIVDFPPVTAEPSAADHAQMLKAMGLVGHGKEADAPPRHAFMHRTRSVDFAIVLEGEIDMLLDDSEVHVKAGEIVIQQGTNHAWVNRGSTTCRMAFVLIDAKE
jgi:mannose-6-phosphate isomerase-like protein (cupin superfamily)